MASLWFWSFSLTSVVFCYQFFIFSAQPYFEYKDVNLNFQELDENYEKIKAAVLNKKNGLQREDLAQQFEALDKFYSDFKDNAIEKRSLYLPRSKREAIDNVTKCCKTIEKYLDTKSDAVKALCTENAVPECCKKFQKEVGKQKQAHKTVCATNERDECSSSPCDEKATCQNTLSSFSCTCMDGYSGDGFQCTDIDECAAGGLCATSATCKNTEGSFICNCIKGYQGDGFVCSDTNECLDLTTCNAEATCTNLPGSFFCKCNAGFTGDGFQCTNQDECKLSSPCSKKSSCANTIGSYKCKCYQGYTGDGATCIDINECSAAVCDKNAVCQNIDGSYSCSCKEGFMGDGKTCKEAYRFRIYNPAHQKCMTVVNNKTLTLRTCEQTAVQMWRWTQSGQLQNVLLGKCLRPDNIEAWTVIGLVACDSHDVNQLWTCPNKGTVFIRPFGTTTWYLNFGNAPAPDRVTLHTGNGSWSFWVAYDEREGVCEFKYPTEECKRPLGMQSGAIPDSAISSDTIRGDKYKPKFGRLGHVGTNCSWAVDISEESTPNLWISLGQGALVTGIATQGSCYAPDEWVKSYVIHYLNGKRWDIYQVNGMNKIFPGNTDSSSITYNPLPHAIYTKSILVVVDEYNKYPTMRLELYTC